MPPSPRHRWTSRKCDNRLKKQKTRKENRSRRRKQLTKPAFIVIPLVLFIWDHCESWFWPNIYITEIWEEKNKNMRKTATIRSIQTLKSWKSYLIVLWIISFLIFEIWKFHRIGSWILSAREGKRERPSDLCMYKPFMIFLYYVILEIYFYSLSIHYFVLQ